MGTAPTVARPWARGRRQGRVDVSVDAIKFATSFDYVDVASATQVSAVCRPRKPGLSCREKGENRLCEGGEGKTRVRRVVDSTQIGELLDEGIDMWVAVNGKRVDRNATVAQIGIHPFVVMGGFWERLNGSESHHKTFRVSGMLTVWAGTGVAHKKIDVFGVVIRNIMILFLLVRSLVQL